MFCNWAKPNPEQEFRFIYLYRRQIPLIKEVFYFMRKKQINNIVWSAVLIILISVLIGGLFLKSKPNVEIDSSGEVESNQIEQNTEEKNEETKTQLAKIVATSTLLKTENSDLSVKKITFKIDDREIEASIDDNSTVLDLMNSLMKENKLVFDGKNYPGLGFFVTEINGLKSGDGKNLMYDINGKEASLGVSSYVVKEGDIIEWKLK